MVSEPYRAENLLDRLTDADTLQVHYDQEMRRERELLDRQPGARERRRAFGRLRLASGPPPVPAARLPHDRRGPRRGDDRARCSRTASSTPAGWRARASCPTRRGSFDVVLYRLVLHHVAYQGPLAPVFEEAARLLRPGGALVAVEPGSWHPVGRGPDARQPRQPRPVGTRHAGRHPAVAARARRGRRAPPGCEPELHGLTYGWRRLPVPVQRGIHRLDPLGSRPRAAPFAHTLLLIARP